MTQRVLTVLAHQLPGGPWRMKDDKVAVDGRWRSFLNVAPEDHTWPGTEGGAIIYESPDDAPLAPREVLAEMDRSKAEAERQRRALYAASLGAPPAEKLCADGLAALLADEVPGGCIEYPIQVAAIASTGTAAWEPGRDAGAWVKVRPASGSETYLGVLLGTVALGIGSLFNPGTGVLHVGLAVHNPAIWVPALKRVVFGMESWWERITKPEELQAITDESIQSTWYVAAARALVGESEARPAGSSKVLAAVVDEEALAEVHKAAAELGIEPRDVLARALEVFLAPSQPCPDSGKERAKCACPICMERRGRAKLDALRADAEGQRADEAVEALGVMRDELVLAGYPGGDRVQALVTFRQALADLKGAREALAAEKADRAAAEERYANQADKRILAEKQRVDAAEARPPAIALDLLIQGVNLELEGLAEALEASAARAGTAIATPGLQHAASLLRRRAAHLREHGVEEWKKALTDAALAAGEAPPVMDTGARVETPAGKPERRGRPCTCNSAPSPQRCRGQSQLGKGWYCVEGKP